VTGLDKVVPSVAAALADVVDGNTVAVAGFGVSGIPSVLIQALLDRGTTDLEAPNGWSRSTPATSLASRFQSTPDTCSYRAGNTTHAGC